jgi:hypothetical protein
MLPCDCHAERSEASLGKNELPHYFRDGSTPATVCHFPLYRDTSSVEILEAFKQLRAALGAFAVRLFGFIVSEATQAKYCLDRPGGSPIARFDFRKR